MYVAYIFDIYLLKCVVTFLSMGISEISFQQISYFWNLTKCRGLQKRQISHRFLYADSGKTMTSSCFHSRHFLVFKKFCTA